MSWVRIIAHQAGRPEDGHCGAPGAARPGLGFSQGGSSGCERRRGRAALARHGAPGRRTPGAVPRVRRMPARWSMPVAALEKIADSLNAEATPPADPLVCLLLDTAGEADLAKYYQRTHARPANPPAVRRAARQSQEHNRSTVATAQPSCKQLCVRPLTSQFAQNVRRFRQAFGKSPGWACARKLFAGLLQGRQRQLAGPASSCLFAAWARWRTTASLAPLSRVCGSGPAKPTVCQADQPQRAWTDMIVY